MQRITFNYALTTEALSQIENPEEYVSKICAREMHEYILPFIKKDYDSELHIDGNPHPHEYHGRFLLLSLEELKVLAAFYNAAKTNTLTPDLNEKMFKILSE